MKLIKLKKWLDLRNIYHTFQSSFEYGGGGFLWPKEELKFEFDEKEWIAIYEPEWTRERVALRNPPNTQNWIFKNPAMIVEYLEHHEKIDYDLKLAYEVIRNYVASSTRHKCKRNVSEFSSMTEENKATFIRGCNNPSKLLEEIPASPVKNQARRNGSLCGPEEFGVRQGMPESRPVEEGVQGPALSPPVKQESCTGSNPDEWNYVYKSQVIKTSCKENGGAWPEGGFAENHGSLVGRGWELVLEPCRAMLWRPFSDTEPRNWSWTWGVSEGCPAQTMIEEVLKKIGQLEDEYWE